LGRTGSAVRAGRRHRQQAVGDGAQGRHGRRTRVLRGSPDSSLEEGDSNPRSPRRIDDKRPTRMRRRPSHSGACPVTRHTSAPGPISGG
jgi:hypothetical protein